MSEQPKRHITPLFTVANQVLVNFFRQEGADNFIAHEIEDKDTGQSYLILMQKIQGETPVHQLAKSKADCATLESTLQELHLMVTTDQSASKDLKDKVNALCLAVGALD